MNIGKKIKYLNNSIQDENLKINDLYKQIDEYEAIIELIDKSNSIGNKKDYRQKIEQCHVEIEKSIEKIQSMKNQIALIEMDNEDAERGEKCA